MTIRHLVIFITFITGQAVFGGHSSGGGGGGSGVACFQTPSDKDAFIDPGTKKISKAGREKLISLETLDSWEYPDLVYLWPNSTDTVETYLARTLTESLEPVSPYFLYRIQSALELLKRNRWQDVSAHQPVGLARLEDVGYLARKIPANCERVQIFIRESESSPGMEPKIKVQYDQDLYQRLGLGTFGNLSTHQKYIFQTAIMNLHEALYILGTELKHATSSDTRKLARALLSAKLRNDLLRQVSRQRDRLPKFIQVLRELNFDRHFSLFFAPEALEGLIGPMGTAESRQLSYQKLVRIYETSSGLSWSSGRAFEKNLDQPETAVFDDEVERSIVTTADTEIAFLRAAMAISYRNSLNLRDVEFFLVPGVSRLMNLEWTYTCTEFSWIHGRTQSPTLRRLLEMASSYCQAIHYAR
jgi:hypothetical protein